MHFIVLSLFPEMFNGVLDASILKLARQNDLLQVDFVNFRDYSLDKHQKVDDRPYGGGPGMVIKPEPVVDAVESVEKEHGPVRRIMLTPQGKPFKQSYALEMVEEKRPILLICGRYEGFDERIRLILKPEEICIGDFILSGGEIAAMTLIDAITRLIPGALGGEGATEEESFSDSGKSLEYAQYTRPPEYRGLGVPEILLSGHHEKIAEWRREESIKRTVARRPDLVDE